MLCVRRPRERIGDESAVGRMENLEQRKYIRTRKDKTLLKK